MKTNIRILLLFVFCSIATMNLAYKNGFLSSEDNSLGLKLYVKTVLASSEQTKSCLKGTYVDRKPNVGSSCWCGDKVITKQDCVSGGSGCTEIDCD